MTHQYKNRISGVHVVFHKQKKLAFHSRSWSADIDSLGISTGWTHDYGEFDDQEGMSAIGYTWITDRLGFLKANATKPELIWEGCACEDILEDFEEDFEL